MFRKFISFAAMAALMVSAGSCQKEITDGIDDGGAKVSLTLQTVDQQTRAIADASNIDILHWEIYPEDVLDAAKPLAKGSERDTDGDGVFTLDLSLILDQTYNFIFWAQVDPEEGKEHYDVSDLRRVGIKTYDDEKANDESRAAFFAYETIHVSGSIEETITLYRPFSQLNLGTETYDVSSLNLTESLKVNYSEITAYGIADTFNTITGEGEGSREVHFQQNITPNGDEDAVKKILEVNNTSYYWLGMNYLIVNGNSDNVKVDMKFHTTHGEVELSIDNVPVKENYRTNIIGDLLTSEAFFKIVVDEKFQTPDNIVGDEGGSEEGGETPVPNFVITQDGDDLTYTVFTPEGLEAWRVAAHQDALDDTDRKINLILGADIILEYIEGEANWTPVGTYDHPYDGTIDGAGHYISDMSIDSEGEPAGFIGAWDGEEGGIVAQNLIFRNVHILSSNEYGTGTVVGYGHKKYIIKDCHVKGGSVSGIGGGPCGGLFGGGFETGFDQGASGSGKGFGGTAIRCTNSASVITSTITYYVGGIGGFGNAIDCTNTGTVTGSGYYIGGILGGSNGQVTGNKNQGKVTGGVYAGGIVGGIEDGTLENNSNFGDVFGTEEGKLGGIFGWLDESSTTQSGNTYQCIVKVIVVDQDFTVKIEPEVTTYTVYTAEGLEIWRAAAHQNAVDKKSDKVNLLLAADIELPVVEDGSSNWTPLGTTSAPYNGIIDGAGFTISNLTISGGSNVGFIGAASNGGNVVSNLKFANVNVSGAKNVGAVIGQVTNDGKVNNCHILSGKITATGDNVGGILGYSKNYGGVSNSSNAAEVAGASYVGGISGHAYATKSINRGNVTGTGSYVAGVYAIYKYGNTSENQNYGDVTGVDSVAGITANGNSTYSHNEGNITGRDNVAGITCSNSSSSLGNLGACTNKGNIKGRDYVAGIISYSSNSLADCVNEGVIEGEQYVAGIASQLSSRSRYNNTALARNENKGNVSGVGYVSGIVSIISGTYNCNVTENTNSGNIAGEDRVAAILAYNENANVVYNTNSGNITGYTNIAHFVGSQNPSYSPDIVTGNVSTGTLNILENNDFTRTVNGSTVSYIAYTQKGFEAWAQEAHKAVEENFACNLTLETDIVLPVVADGESNWTPIGNYAGTNHPNDFSGNIDGKNHTIYNLTINTTVSGAGFIGQIGGSGSIKNLNLANVNINSTSSNVAAFAGASSSGGLKFDNCHVLSGTVQGSGSYVAGIMARFDSRYVGGTVKITNCSNSANIISNGGYVAGIGCYDVTCENCQNYGNVTNNGKQEYTGGIAARGDVRNSTNSGQIIGYSNTGGITGTGDAENCSNSGNVTGYESVGGITGTGDAVKCENSGTVTGSSKSVGGIVGYLHGTSHKVVECINSGVVSGTTQVGGIIGYASMGSVTDCKNSAKVSATGNKVGGIVGSYSGYSNQSLSGCENSGDVYSDGSYVGGIAGETSDNNCVLTTSINRGNVTGKDYVGGITGNAITVTDCDNYGNVSGSHSVGGIAGSKLTAGKSISGSENKGTVTGVSYLGGIVGFADAGTVTDNVHSGKAIGQDKVAGIVGYNEEAVVTYNTHSGHVEGYTSVAAIVGSQNASYSPDIVTGNVDNGTETVLAPTDYTREVVGSEILYTVYSYDGLMAWHAEASEGCVQGADGNYVIVNLDLQADITMPVVAAGETNWTPIGSVNSSKGYRYRGKIDGNDHTIYNLSVGTGTNVTGFIGALYEGSVKNLKFSNVTVSSSQNYTGTVVGYIYSGLIDNCHVLSGTVTTSASYTGGIVGQGPDDAVHVTNCSNAAVISSTGGHTGGIAGDTDVDNCTNTASVTGGAEYTGGIVGYGDASHSTNSGAVTGTSYTGGIAGKGNVTDCENSGDVTGTVNYVGGITGNGTVTGSDNEGDVNTTKAGDYLGGITGNGGATDCNNYGDVIRKQGSSSEYTGGISGYSSKPVTNCTNSGKVVGSLYVGGIAGYISGTSVTDCENYGVVSADRWHIGGIVGHCLKSTVSGCMNKADISSVGSTASNATSVAGIAGYVEGDTSSISGNVNEAHILGYRALGGIVGYLVNGTVSGNKHTGNISWLDNTTGYNGLIVGLQEGGTVTDDNEGTGTVAQQ